MSRWAFLAALLGSCAAGTARAADPPHPAMKWVKRHPRPDAKTLSPRMGYETSYGYDWLRGRLIRYGGHNQGGGGEQNSEVWVYDLAADVWDLMEPNDAPPGVCCAQQNVFDDALRKFVRFPAFSGSHGWQSWREIYLKDSSAWTYDLDTNTWRAMRPCPEPWPRPLRGAAYDPHHQVTVIHGGEGASHGTLVYDLYTNTWHRMKPAGGPSPRESQPGFTYDAVNRVFVLFGSQFGTDERTWLYDLRKNEWRVLDVAQHPPGAKTSPILAADTRNGIVLCSVQRGEKDSTLETWALDVARKTWTRLDVEAPPPSGNRNRVLLYLFDENLLVLENAVGKPREQQIWTFRYAEAPAPAPRPRNVAVTTLEDGALLTWSEPRGAKPAAYVVYRARGEKLWAGELEPIAKGVKSTAFKDGKVERGTIHSYQVRAVDAAGNEGTPSFVVRAQPRVVVDVIVSALGPKRVEIEWPKAEADDVVGYHVERADVAVYSTEQVKRIRIAQKSDLAAGRVKATGPFQRLTQKPLEEPRFVDEAVDLAAGQREPADPIGGSPLREQDLNPDGRPYRLAVYAYRVRAVNRLGVESGPSPMMFTWPAAVQPVFSKETDGEEPGVACHLKWQASRHKGIQGYHVYRHQGRWNKDPIERLTTEPISGTAFLDGTAGKGTRRYEVVAVDALGQEGEPSRPVWYLREWRKYYVPYVGEWHQ